MHYTINENSCGSVGRAAIRTARLGRAEGAGQCYRHYMVYKGGKPYLDAAVPETWNPFDTVCIWNGYFCAGYGDAAGFIDLETGEAKEYGIDFYFGYFYEYRGRLYIASGTCFYCFKEDGSLAWKTVPLAVDGIIANEFSGGLVQLSCEMEPPGGWVERTVRLESGLEEI